MASKSYRKFMATGLSAAVVASVVAPVAGAAFDDVKPGSWYEGAVNYVTEAGYMKGTDKGFEPGKEMTRAQAAALFANILGIYDDSLEADFSDVKEGAWYYGAVAAVQEHGIMAGTGSAFNPEGKLTRGQVAALVVRAYDLEAEGAEHSFTDVEGNMFENEIAILAELGIASGTTGGKFEPNKVITRAEMAAFIQKVEAPAPTPLPEVESVKAVDATSVEVTVEGSYTQEDVDYLVESGAYELSVVAGDDVHEVGKVTVKAAEASASADTTTLVLSEISPELPAGEELSLAVNGEVVEGTEFKYEAPVTPEVTSVSAINLKQVVVTFNQDVDATTAGTTGNYAFASGSGVTVTNASVEGKTVTLTVSGAAQQQTADLTVENVKTSKGDVVAKTTKSVKFVDMAAPTVSSVTAAGPKTVKVKFSEPLSSVPTFSLNDGTISIVSTSFSAGDTEATLTLGTAPASGTYNLKVKGGLDYAGFKIEEVVKEFNFAVDTAAPTVSVKSASPTQIVLLFNEDVSGVLDNNVEFFHTYNGVNAYKATKSLSGKELTLSFANPLPEGAFKLYLDYVSENGTQIADLWGNKVAEQTITGTVVSDTVAPTVTKVEAVNNTAFEVTYSEAVTGATNAANYEVKDAAGKVVNINGSITNVSGNKYSIPFSALNGGSYTLTIKNIKDVSINQNKLADYSTTVAVKDIVPPTVSDLDAVANGTQAQLLSNKKVKIVFSEVMDKASIENKLNYLNGGAALDSKVTITAVDGNKAVILDFTDVTGAQANPASASLSVLRVVDAAGNPISAVSTTVLVPASVSAPIFDKAEATGQNTVKLYFKETITGAQADDFLVSIDNGSNWVVAGGISNEVIDGKSVITLTTGNNIPTTVANVKVKSAAANVDAKNSYGSAVDLGVNGVTVGDKFAPEMVSAVAKETDGDNFVNAFEITFSEALYVPSVNDTDFTIEGYTIESVSVNSNVVTLVVEEKTTNDLSAAPKVALVSSVEDLARNSKASQIAITATSVSGQASADAAAVAAAQTALTVGYTSPDTASSVTQNVTLATTLNGASISWASDNAAITNAGVVTRPANGSGDATVTLTATIVKGASTATKTFTLTVLEVPAP
ncbi:S-layer homology domain-containing protein [Fictibacillus sp. NPDC058756]|uniref:S-layer homology domain-containing protein n=1 Tax=Fictibacillus sp. NPDC058756 TaxID=3346625 RepID=UPI0036CE4550